MKYIVVTPARDEESNIGKTIESMVGQTVLPARWVIVNDGSTDRTGRIIDQAAARHSWVRAIHRANRGFRKNGGGVVDVFYEGYESIGRETYDFLVKLDGDLSFEADYFEKCLGYFSADPKLGIGGGTVCTMAGGALVQEMQGDPPFHVRGATKIYRRACWQAIGGIVRTTGWDTLDEIKANMLGWSTYTFRELKLLQYRKTGGADGHWKNWQKNGLANYISGYHPLFMACKCLKRLFRRPYGIASVALMTGFAKGYVQRIAQVEDKALIQYIRQQQLRRLKLQKSIWN